MSSGTPSTLPTGSASGIRATSTAAYTDTTTLNIGCTYAYRVTTFAGTKTGPGAIATLYIDASADDPDEQAVLEIIKKIEALKPIDLLTAADEQRVRELLAEYNALTDAQKEQSSIVAITEKLRLLEYLVII